MRSSQLVDKMLLKIVKLTQNVRTKSNTIETNNRRALPLFIKYVI